MEIGSAFEVDQLADDDKGHRCLSLKGGYSCGGNFSNCQQLKWREGRHQLLGAVKRVSENMRPTLQGPFFATAIQIQTQTQIQTRTTSALVAQQHTSHRGCCLIQMLHRCCCRTYNCWTALQCDLKKSNFCKFSFELKEFNKCVCTT